MKKDIKIKKENLETTAPLYHRYDGQIYPQPAYIEIDPRGDEIEVSADYSGEIGNAVPMCVWNDLVYRIACPNGLLGESLVGYLESAEFSAQVKELCEGYEVYWDGSNHVGRWNQRANQIEDVIESDLRELRYVQIYEGDDWIEDSIKYIDADGNACSYSSAVKAIYNDTTEVSQENISALVEDSESWADSDTMIVNLEGAFKNIIDILEENQD